MDCDRCLLTKFELIQSLVDIKEHAALCKAPLQRDLNTLMLFLEGVLVFLYINSSGEPLLRISAAGL